MKTDLHITKHLWASFSKGHVSSIFELSKSVTTVCGTKMWKINKHSYYFFAKILSKMFFIKLKEHIILSILTIKIFLEKSTILSAAAILTQDLKI